MSKHLGILHVTDLVVVIRQGNRIIDSVVGPYVVAILALLVRAHSNSQT